jgi:ferritin
MLSEPIQNAINRQIDIELAGSHFYLALSTWCDDEGFRGAAAWLRGQSLEERGHALKLIDYMGDRGGKVTLGALAQPDADFASLLDVFKAVLQQERDVTEAIHELFRTAESQRGEPSLQVLLHWFIEEQVEEERTAGDIVDDLKRVEGDSTGLLIVDRGLAEMVPAGEPGAPKV